MPAPRLPRVIFGKMRREPRRFQYNPRHFDEEKQELEARLRKIEAEVARERGEKLPESFSKEFVPRVNLRETWERSRNTHNVQSRSANLRFVIILAVLLVLAGSAIYYMEYLEKKRLEELYDQPLEEESFQIIE